MKRVRLQIQGLVQGLGFRPFVFRLANQLNLKGRVSNTSSGVTIECEGPESQIQLFQHKLQHNPPPLAYIQSINVEQLDSTESLSTSFIIDSSQSQVQETSLILPDLATCQDCLDELFTPTDHRYNYPFINCIHCGPRYTIIDSLPYDRPRTSMHVFPMCEACKNEYNNPMDRRFHAQPIACPECGPHLSLWDQEGKTLTNRQEALHQAIQALQQGEVIAVLGLGGFQLWVDATNEDAVQALRRRKHRPDKPFALMFPTLQMIQEDCIVSTVEANLLTYPEAPIVLLQCKRKETYQSNVAHSVAPGLMQWGVMLPSTPLHHLLLRALKCPVVATSGNRSGEPLFADPEEAVEGLQGIADKYLVHNRPILHPIDDSILQVIGNTPQMLRRARGYAPLPLHLPKELSHSQDPILAMGADRKAVITLHQKDQVWLSPHIGDLAHPRSLQLLQHHQQTLEEHLRTKPSSIVCDPHPEYHSHHWGQTQADQAELPVHYVQHHRAHAWAGRLEHNLQPPFLAFTWDGTGYGSDGTIWGGEAFQCLPDGAMQRVCHLRTFPLPGGEKAILEPKRIALGLLYEMLGEQVFEDPRMPLFAEYSDTEWNVLRSLLQRKKFSPLCSSMGRLFDAFACLLGFQQTVSFEAQAPIALESWAQQAQPCPNDLLDKATALPLIHRDSNDPMQWDWSTLVQTILQAKQQGKSKEAMALLIHSCLASTVIETALHFKATQVLVTGGSFQNRLLLTQVIQKAQNNGINVYWPQKFPANDGGIALGQIASLLYVNSTG